MDRTFLIVVVLIIVLAGFSSSVVETEITGNTLYVRDSTGDLQHANIQRYEGTSRSNFERLMQQVGSSSPSHGAQVGGVEPDCGLACQACVDACIAYKQADPPYGSGEIVDCGPEQEQPEPAEDPEDVFENILDSCLSNAGCYTEITVYGPDGVSLTTKVWTGCSAYISLNCLTIAENAASAAGSAWDAYNDALDAYNEYVDCQNSNKAEEDDCLDQCKGLVDDFEGPAITILCPPFCPHP